ncbi:KH domain-containing protein HEN4 [Cocos nucifera]|uniref:KH domain-containing protein HEN4 n=1 Tax=Cocos nucifera TaxID=13894 RepID=A0A8K0MXJ0_COCNU|nr:KH domain-containing protein HEN4 [Cocos nucifera]
MEASSAVKRPLEPSSSDPNGPFPSPSSAAAASKRRPPHSPAAHFRALSPRVKSSPNETLFRILCPADRTGGVIGKGGSIVRQFREETGAKIRIEDSVQGSEDRVIIIIAEAPPKKRRDDGGGNGGEAAEDDASPAQRALVRVFERMLRVESERVGEGNGGGGEGGGGGEEKEIQGQVVCKLLAPSSQVGCILGKGGKIVEKIRQESGAQIRIFGKDQVPLCAVAGDELIHICFRQPENYDYTQSLDRIGILLGIAAWKTQHYLEKAGFGLKSLSENWLGHSSFCVNFNMVQISGSFSAVKKALLSVSRCLQDNPRAESTNFTIPKPFGPTSHGAGPPTMMDPYAQRSLLPSQHVPDYHSRGYSSNPGMDNIVSGHRKVLEEDVMFRILCSNDKVGSIIGKAGVIIRALQSETGATIKIVDPIPDSDEKVILISAHETSELRHSPAQDAVLRVHSRLAEAGFDKSSAISARLLVPAQQIGCLLGKGGTIIAEMRRATGASIRIFLKEQVPKCAQPNDELVQDALLHITSRIRETIFPMKTFPSAGMTQYTPAASEIPPFPRPIHEPAPPGRYSTVGPFHGADASISLSNIQDRLPPLSHGVDRLVVDRIPMSYGPDATAPHPAVDHPSPRLWAPEVISTRTPRGTPDAGTGFRSGGMGCGGQTPVATSNTVEPLETSRKVEHIIPQKDLTYVYGENNSNLAEIRQISGAQFTIHDAVPGATAGRVVISGTPRQVKMGQSLMHAFIMWGRYIKDA